MSVKFISVILLLLSFLAQDLTSRLNFFHDLVAFKTNVKISTIHSSASSAKKVKAFSDVFISSTFVFNVAQEFIEIGFDKNFLFITLSSLLTILPRGPPLVH